MRVAVVVTVLNEEASIRSLLHALASQTRPADEVIVVDGGSVDRTCEVVEDLATTIRGLRPMRVPGSDIAHGRNVGIAASGAEVIAVTDAGCIPTPGWLEELVRPLETDPTVDLVVGTVIPDARTPFEECVARCSLTPDVRIAGCSLNPTARSLAFRRALWERAGMFPEQPPFNRGEDGVFIRRASRLGRLAVAQNATVRWRPRGSYGAILRQFHGYARGVAELGETRVFHARTLAQSLGGLCLVLLGVLTGHWFPWVALLVMAGAYLVRKARAGCFGGSSWRAVYWVPLILATIHVGTMAGIIHGTIRRWQRR